MSIKIQLTAVIAAFLAMCNSSLAQGSLTPPGAPAPTMRSLDQIEARTPISSAPFIINQPGSYYLTTNVSVVAGAVISIATNDVVIDLNGFYLKGGGGIFVGGSVSNLTVRRGSIKNAGRGVGFGGIPNCRIEDLTIIGNSGDAIEVGDNAVVRRCTLDGNNGFGVVATPISGANVVAEDCVIRSNSFGGISLGVDVVVRNCVLQGNGTNGITLGANGRVKGCQAIQNQNAGISIGAGGVVSETLAEGNSGLGISVGDFGTIDHCNALQNSSAGISSGNNCSVENCNVSQNSSGGILTGNNSSIASCIAQRNTGVGISGGSSNRAYNCTAAANTSNGLFAGDGSQMLDCEASGNGGRGILVNRYCAVSGCTATGNSQSGIYVGWFSGYILNNTCTANNTLNSTLEAGIVIDDSDNRVDGNHVARNGYAGIMVISSYINNVVVRNSVAGNGANNYLGTNGNDFGPISTAAAATSPWANISH